MIGRVRAFVVRLSGGLFPWRRDREIALELESHLQLHVDDNIRAGMTPAEARRRALIQLGGVVQTTERYRDRGGFPVFDVLRQDLAYALRMLRRSPGFTATAVLTLALGVGANTAMFSLVNAVLLRPLAFRSPDRLVMLFATDRQRGDHYDVSSFPDFVDWGMRTRAFDALAAFAARPISVAAVGGDAELVQGKQISPGMFEALGVQPALGRSFRIEEQQAGASQVAVLTDGYWKRHYGSSPDVLGQTIRINDAPHVVVGVMPPGFRVSPGDDEQLYVPLVVDVSRGHGFLRVIGRLREGITLAQAQADMTRVTKELAALYPRYDANVGVNVVPLVDAFAVNVRNGLLVLVGVVGVVLVIACANVAGLLLARGATRARELAVRAALGADRRRIARQLLTESIVLAGMGGALGLVVADLGARALGALLAENFHVPRVDGVRTDVWVLAFTAFVSIATGLVFGVAPALSWATPDVNGELRDGGRTASTVRAPRLRSLLVIVETALALVLLAGAAVLLRTFVSMRNTPAGFETDNRLAAALWLPQPRFAKLSERAQFYTEALASLRTRPGVQSAAFVNDLPLVGGTDSLGFHVVGKPDPTPRGIHRAGFNIASPDYFRTMGIPMTSGREFQDADGAGTVPVVVVNETAAHRFWPGEPAVGGQITMPGSGGKSTTLTVVGIAGDVRHESLAMPPRPEFFLCSMQAPLAWSTVALVVRTTREPSSMISEVIGTLRQVDRQVPIQRVGTMEDVVATSVAAPRLYTLLVGMFALLALGLAAIGLYGLVSYAASRRMQEMGVRVALGAPRGEILRLVMGQGWRPAAVGAAIGVVAAIAATRTLVGLVAGVRPTDPTTYAAVVVVMLLIALVASYVPARRAARVDPMLALRSE